MRNSRALGGISLRPLRFRVLLQAAENLKTPRTPRTAAENAKEHQQR